MARDRRLTELTARWQARRAARRRSAQEAGRAREPADPGRAARAASAFPYRETSPADYVARHGAEMTAYTYDDYAYADAELQAWLDQVGELLRRRRKDR